MKAHRVATDGEGTKLIAALRIRQCRNITFGAAGDDRDASDRLTGIKIADLTQDRPVSRCNRLCLARLNKNGDSHQAETQPRKAAEKFHTC